jgi:hypothetical protein
MTSFPFFFPFLNFFGNHPVFNKRIGFVALPAFSPHPHANSDLPFNRPFALPRPLLSRITALNRLP